ncbi:hypothetical protein AB0D11_32610 [Streptomyces monashensis]|uniref:hypothetical protein n=1 Tax=Streptomyces monashensis TaxID=1678012 RepID=UPI0033F34C46
MTPELPAEPTDEQLAAWLELAELTLDGGFRAAVRRLVHEHARTRTQTQTQTQTQDVPSPPRPDPIALARELAGPALAAGTRPDAPRAEPVVAALLTRCEPTAQTVQTEQTELLRHLEAARDPRRDRWFRLLARINARPAPEPTTALIDRTVTALRVHASAA